MPQPTPNQLAVLLLLKQAYSDDQPGYLIVRDAEDCVRYGGWIELMMDTTD